MREIKFRGKSIDTREWVYGYYIKSGPDFHGGERHCIATPGTVADYAGLKFIQVDPKTVGQFSGVPDMNGREIYEGDLIDGNLFDNRLPIRGVVVYDERHCFYALKNDAGHTALFRIANMLKIGTIHENPEVLS